MAQSKCKIKYKGVERMGYIVETKLDKIKVQIVDSAGATLHTNWFENKEIKRIW